MTKSSSDEGRPVSAESTPPRFSADAVRSLAGVGWADGTEEGVRTKLAEIASRPDVLKRAERESVRGPGIPREDPASLASRIAIETAVGELGDPRRGIYQESVMQAMHARVTVPLPAPNGGFPSDLFNEDDKPTVEEAPVRESQAQALVRIGREAELFRDPEGDLYATFCSANVRETCRLRSAEFRRYLTRRFFQERRRGPSADAIAEAKATLEAIADSSDEIRAVALRVGLHDGDLYIDLGDSTRKAVRVTAYSWEVIEDPPVRFVRGRSSAALPLPRHGGSLTDLLPFLHARDPTEAHFVLSVAWLLGAFHPNGPYPILAIDGEQGAGKTEATRWLKSLSDPTSPPHRSAPKEERDLAVAGRGSWVLAFDNLSGIPGWLSDALCRLSTGGGFATRALYTDDEEIVFSGKRPVIFNGITPGASAADLRDRCLLVTWPTLQDGRTERELDADFERVRDAVFGAVLDALVAALAGHETAAEEYGGKLPRMADFFAWVVAAEKAGALPWPVGTFERIYTENRQAGVEKALSENTIAAALDQLLEIDGQFEGTATALLTHLTDLTVSPGRSPPLGWPKNPSALGSALRRMAPDLRRAGVDIEFDRQGKGRRTVLIRRWAEDKRGTPSPPSPRHPSDGKTEERPPGSLSPPPSPNFSAVGDSEDTGDTESRYCSDPPNPGASSDHVTRSPRSRPRPGEIRDGRVWDANDRRWVDLPEARA
ncbi:MAG: hypothetical protein M1126_01675 [Candidatus Thermoplasmatota archaeon]|nr:hypothetical protein [Candidatus Thermoplasmatota archaeon]